MSNLSVLKSKVARAGEHPCGERSDRTDHRYEHQSPEGPAAYHDAVGTILLKKVGEALQRT